jgi:integrase
MAAKILTAITCRNAHPGAGRREIPDRGCAGLHLVVQSSGHKSWAVRFRYRGQTRKLTLGSFLDNGGQEPGGEPVIGTPLSLASARQLAAQALRQAKSGVDPCAEKQRHRVAQRVTEADTLQAISEEFLRRVGAGLRSVSQRRADLELLYGPLGRMPVTEIKRGQYTRALDRIADERGPLRADRVLAAVKRLLSWHSERSDFISPLGRGGRRVKPNALVRERVLSIDELRQVWTTAETYPGPFGAYLRFTLLTACRRNESAGLRRGELSDGGKTWTIPGARYKNGKDTLIPLSRAAQKIIAEQPQLGDFVFTSKGTCALGGFALRKTQFDKACGIDGWTIHDLRRSSRTLLSRAGIPADIAERCLGHAIGGVRGVYDRHAYELEKRRAFEALARLIERIVRTPEAKVTDLAAERSKRRQRR